MSRTIVNDMVALIPEWVVEEKGLNNKGVKVGNAFILSSKDLSGIEGDSFTSKAIKLGGVPTTPREARSFISGELKPIIFEEPEVFTSELVVDIPQDRKVNKIKIAKEVEDEYSE